MVTRPRWMRLIGLVLHGLIGGLMLFAGSGKLFGFAPEQVVTKMSTYHMGDKLQLIGAGEMLAALLLLIPRTRSLGLLLTSGFWGGVICIHMAHQEDFLFPSLLLALTWVGAFLRDPMTFASFAGSTPRVPATDQAASP